MSSALTRIDAHAHIETGVDPADLAALDCVVFAVTREAREWPAIQRRKDAMTVWGVGCHPGYPLEVSRFSGDEFAEAIKTSALVGEVGLDARANTAMNDQQRVFSQVLEIVAGSPRLISIHSVGASKQVLDTLARHPQKAAILHWWRGSPAQTTRAIDLGCYFSLNGAEVRRPKILKLIPPERILTETDYPFTERSDRQADRPGAVTTIEKALQHEWETDRTSVRGRLWSNLSALSNAADCREAMPSGITERLLTPPL